MRRTRETKARLRNNADNLSDILTRMNVRSDLGVQFFEPKVVCGLCEREGHSQLKCDYHSSRVGQNMSYEDFLFWCHVDPCDCPEDFFIP